MYEMWDIFNWSKIIFNDETKIELHYKKREFVTKLKGKQK